MTTITLELPEDIVQDLNELDTDTLASLLRQVIRFSKSLQNGALSYAEMLNDNASQSQEIEASSLDVHDFVLLPPAPMPEFEPPLSKEEWKKQLLAAPSWTHEELDAFEEAREYMNQWTPRSF